jgi:hypothetical protein
MRPEHKAQAVQFQAEAHSHLLFVEALSVLLAMRIPRHGSEWLMLPDLRCSWLTVSCFHLCLTSVERETHGEKSQNVPMRLQRECAINLAK